jgi:hypothetical protein
MEYKDAKQALEYLASVIPNRAYNVQNLKAVAISIQQYEVASNLRDREKKLIAEEEAEKKANEINNQK